MTMNNNYKAGSPLNGGSMSNEILDEIQASLLRIETSLDSGLAQLNRHVSDGHAQTVAKLVRQRGYVLTSLAAVGAGIAAATDYAIKRVVGH